MFDRLYSELEGYVEKMLISFTSERNKILADEKIQNLLKNK